MLHGTPRTREGQRTKVAKETPLRAHLDQVLHTVVLPGFTRLNSEGAR